MLLTPSLFGLHDGTISGLSENCCAIAALTRKNLSNPLTVNCASTFVGQLTKVRDSQSCPINTNISIVDTSGEVSVLNNSILGRIYFVNPTLCKFPTLTFLHPLINMAEFNQNGQQIDWTLSGAFGTRAYFPRLDSKHGARIKVTSKGSKADVADVYCRDENSSPYNPGIVVNFLFDILVYSFSKTGEKKCLNVIR